MASYSPVFSSQFIVYTDSAPTTSFEVPAGFTAVIRDFSAFGQYAATIYQVAIQNSDEAPNCVVAQIELVGVADWGQVQGRWVVPAGGFINLYMGELEIGSQAYVGGYLLRDTLS